MSNTQAPLPKDDPRLIAWEKYKQTDEFKNTIRWAGVINVGSLWAAFLVGWTMCIAFHEGEMND